MGRAGPVTLKEKAVDGPDGRVERVRYKTALLSPANLLRFVGTGLAATGLYLQFNWAMMLTGLGLAAVGLYLGWQQERSKGLDPEYAMLPKVGGEIRSEKIRGAASRKRPAILRRRAQPDAPQRSVEHSVRRSSASGRKHHERKVVDIDAGHFHVHWDAPHDKETISLARLFEISSHLGEVLNSGKVSYVQL